MVDRWEKPTKVAGVPVYEHSRALYRSLIAIAPPGAERDRLADRRALLAACEHAIDAIAHGTAPPRVLALRLFGEVRHVIAVAEQLRALEVIEARIEVAAAVLRPRPARGARRALPSPIEPVAG